MTSRSVQYATFVLGTAVLAGMPTLAGAVRPPATRPAGMRPAQTRPAESRPYVPPGESPRTSHAYVTVAWEGDLATLRQDEPLADAPSGADSFSILSGPYVGRLTHESAVIGWEVVAARVVTSHPYPSFGADIPMDRFQFRSAALANLKTDTRYRYRLLCGRHTGAEGSFRTLPAPGTKHLRFAVVGDTQRSVMAD